MIDTIFIEGVDKTGKDLIVKYINELSNFKYVTHARGCISNVVYDLLYERDNDMEYTLDDHTLYVLLDADNEDLNIRFKITGEKSIDLMHHRVIFKEIFREMTDGHFWLEFNTSRITPFMVANKILRYVNLINSMDNKRQQKQN